MDGAVADEEWLPLAAKAARFFFRNYQGLSVEDREDACSAAVLEGIRAARAWKGEGVLRAFVWVAMQRGITDWLRLELGRRGQKAGLRTAVSLDVPIGESGPSLGGTLVDQRWDESFELIDELDLLASIIDMAPLTAIEREWVDNLRGGQTARVLAARTGVTEAAVSQAGRRAIRKLKATVRS